MSRPTPKKKRRSCAATIRRSRATLPKRKNSCRNQEIKIYLTPPKKKPVEKDADKDAGKDKDKDADKDKDKDPKAAPEVLRPTVNMVVMTEGC